MIDKDTHMAKYTVAVEWIMWTDVDVEAESLDEAIRLVEAMPDLPKNGEYLDSSFKVNREITEENNLEEV
jgi:hypothetical protein